MARGRITKRAVDALRCPAGKDRDLFWDEALTGFGVAVFASGKKVYVVCFDADSLDVIDVASNKVTGEVLTGLAPTDVVFSPNGRTGYVANSNDDTVSVFDVASGEETQTIAPSPAASPRRSCCCRRSSTA